MPHALGLITDFDGEFEDWLNTYIEEEIDATNLYAAMSREMTKEGQNDASRILASMSVDEDRHVGLLREIARLHNVEILHSDKSFST